MLKEKLAAKKPTPLGWHTYPKERMRYYLYFTGQNMIYTLVTSFLTAYLLLSGIDITKAATVMLAVKVWDAVNDAIFGCVFDKVKFKSKKRFIPWLRISLFAIPISTILLYAIPGGASQTVKLIWFAVTYIIWDTAYTLCDAPVFGLITAMTDIQDERTKIQSHASIWSGLGVGISFITATLLADSNINAAFTVAAIIIGVLAFLVMNSLCRKGEERFSGDTDESFTVRKMLKYLFTNKYLLLYYAGVLFYRGLDTVNMLNLLVSFFLFNNTKFSMIVTVISSVPMLIFALFVPKLVKRFGRIRVHRFSAICLVIANTVIWLVGHESMALFVILALIRSVPAGVCGVMMFMFTPDCAEYGKFKSGIDAKGITFAIQTFMAKLTGAIASSFGMFVLGLFGWVEINAQNFEQIRQLGITQTPRALEGLWFTYMLLPAIGALIAAVVWLLYRVKDNDVELMAKCNNGEISRSEAIAQFSPTLKKEFANTDK